MRDGVLQGYFLGSYSARKLGMASTGNAGGAHNLVVSHGDDRPRRRCCARMGRGLLVTEQLGPGREPRDRRLFARRGRVLDRGRRASPIPVEEITIAGNLKDVFRDIVAIGRDVDRRGSRHVGSMLVGSMTVAGH